MARQQLNKKWKTIGNNIGISVDLNQVPYNELV